MTIKTCLLRSTALLLAAGWAAGHVPVLGATPAIAAPKQAIAVAVADQKSLFYIAAVAGMRDEAKKDGYDLRVASADNNSTQQINQVQNLLVQQPGALIFISQDATSASAGVRAANGAGVPVIAVDEKPEGGDLKLATYIATDSVKAADELCTWMFAQIGDKGNIAILHGVLGATAELQRTQGCQDALKANPGIHVVAEQTANWDENEAYKVAQNILTAHPDLKAIFGESDAMAMGAAKAAKHDDRDGLVVVGIDGFPTMFKAIKAGLTQATKAQRPYEMGEIAVRDAVQLMQDKNATIPPIQLMDAQLINKSNVDQFSPTTFYGPNAATMY